MIMRGNNFFLLYLITVAAQILVNNYLNLSQFLFINCLPALILCVPYRIKSPLLLIITFITGFLVDLLAGGMVGLTLLALLPVAFLRNFLFQLILGEDTLDRMETLSSKKHGSFRVSMVLLLLVLLFFIIYVWTDSAGTRPLWFNTVKVLASTAASYIVSLLIVRIAAP